MIDVFVRVHAETALREFLARAVIERAKMLADARVRVLQAREQAATWWGVEGVSGIALEHFARESREAADAFAHSPIYVLIDDDQLPIGRDWLRAGVEALDAHPEFAMLSSWSVNGEVKDPGFAGPNHDVFEVESCGTPCFVRKGTFVDLPEGPAARYDTILSAHLKRNGARLGFLRHVRHNHLGYGLSQVVPQHWRA